MNTKSLGYSVDESCRRKLEASWTIQPPPLGIVECLPPSHAETYLGTLIELVCCEFEFRCRHLPLAELPRIEEYLQAFPVLNTPQVEWELIAHELEVRRALGGNLPWRELLVRFPNWNNRLREWASEYGEHFDTVSTGATLGTVDADETKSHRPGTVQLDSSPNQWITGSFGQFELIRKIASGGMGVVYLARQTRLNRLVALKFIRSGQLADEQEVRRFLREAENAAQLSHPHIVPIYEVGEWNGNPYFSMAYIEGSSLQDRLSLGRLSDDESAKLLLTIADAVAHAHELKIIHRDLKPANVLIDHANTPYVTDFGLARRLNATSSLTETGQIMGTPAYMAPEQARGDNDQVGECSDQYSLGVILFELLTGKRPFDGPAHVVIANIIAKDPPLPRQLRADVPVDLEAICIKAMQKNPAHRYANVRAMVDDLRHYLQGETIAARRYGRRERWLRLVRKRRAWIAAAASMLTMIAGTWWIASKPTEPLSSNGDLDDQTKQLVLERARSVVASQQNLEAIGLALQNYHQVYKRYPNWAISDRDGRPLLSWRVAILRYLGQEALFRKFRIDEPWNSPDNLKLLELMPDVFRSEGTQQSESSTFYRAFVGQGTCFEPNLKSSVALNQILDGTANTMMIAEAKQPVPWTKPEEITIDSDASYRELGGIFHEGFHGLFADGSVKFFRAPIFQNLAALKALVGRAEGDVVNLNPYKGFPFEELQSQSKQPVARTDAVPSEIESQKNGDRSKAEQPKFQPSESATTPVFTAEDKQRAQKKIKQFTESSNCLNRLQHSILRYESVHRRLPPPAIYSSDGRALLSWRVAILPYIGEETLFKKFRVDEPWDSPHNFQLLPLMPETFRIDIGEGDTPTTTYYQVITGDGTPFPNDPKKIVKLRDLVDGLSQTLGVVEAGVAVPWTKPQDVEFIESGPLPKLGGLFEEGFQAAFFDGSIRSFLRTIETEPSVLRAMIGGRDRKLFRKGSHACWFGDLPHLRFPIDTPNAGAIESARRAALRVRSSNNMRQIMLAMLAYQNGNASFPPVAIGDQQGRPLLSWRVLLLPYLDQSVLYEAFHLDEAWDSPHNQSLLKYMPEVYLAPKATSQDDAEETTTYYQGISGPDAFFDITRMRSGKLAGIRPRELKDGAKRTMVLVEAGCSVPWTKPEDVRYDPNEPIPPLGGVFAEGFHAAMADGLVSFMTLSSENEEELRSFFEIADGKEVDLKRLQAQ